MTREQAQKRAWQMKRLIPDAYFKGHSTWLRVRDVSEKVIVTSFVE